MATVTTRVKAAVRKWGQNGPTQAQPKIILDTVISTVNRPENLDDLRIKLNQEFKQGDGTPEKGFPLTTDDWTALWSKPKKVTKVVELRDRVYERVTT
jgi:hypothetical protein